MCEIKFNQGVNDAALTQDCRREVWLQDNYMAVDKTVFINMRQQ